MPLVRHIDGKFLRLGRNARVVSREHPRTHFAVEREDGNAFAHRQHHLGLRAVHTIPCGSLGRARLQEVGLGHLMGGATVSNWLAQHRKDGANADVDVDIARAIERVKQQQVFTLGIAVRHDMDRVHLFAGHGRQVAAPLIGFDQHLVRNHVQFFLYFALDVLGACSAQHVAERSFVHRNGDALARTRHHFDQQAQLSWDSAMRPLLFNEILGE